MRTKLFISALVGASLATAPAFAAPSAKAGIANPAASLSVAGITKARVASMRGKSNKLSGAALPIALIAVVAIGLGIYTAVDETNRQPTSS